ncbi:MAG: glycyl-radical enzyme activating protein [Syntrophobacterales bacterium CG_4_8_14_3_um_filter_49_14]|nr:MAG: glycyl-radical enzyme activating protein [Syntrophobacterales bacterium CG_4_8_14_3_um_filter_49_14]
METGKERENLHNERGVVFNIQRFSIHDGPGIRSTVFLKGCPLHCPWCQNPESIRLSPEIITRDIKCIRCAKCAGICPQRAISIGEEGRVIEWGKCNYCLKCAEICPSKSIEASGEYKSVDEVMEEVAKDSNFYRRSGGGMTVSGGEPLVQWRFTLALLQKARQKGIHTALDTTGYADWEALAEVLNYTKLVLYDLKHMDSARHKEVTGVSNELILENLEKTVKKPGLKVWIRRPIILGFNDSKDELEELCRFVLTLGPTVEKISLLPFHKFAELKYTATGKVYPYHDVPILSDERVEELRRLVLSHGLKADVGK